MLTLTLPQRFDFLLATRRLSLAFACERHDFTDEAEAKNKRLRAGEVRCVRCGIVVPFSAAFLYHQGLRHGGGSL